MSDLGFGALDRKDSSGANHSSAPVAMVSLLSVLALYGPFSARANAVSTACMLGLHVFQVHFMLFKIICRLVCIKKRTHK